MAQDQQTYQRAASAALIGLLTHLGLAITMALLGLYANSPALHAATWHLFGGLPIWVVLWVLYHQHQLERQEALEAEQLARTDARAAALFDEAGDNLALARRRLESMQKWWLPAVSLLVATYLATVGGILLYLNWTAQQAGTLQRNILGEAAANNVEIVAVVLIVIGFVAFLIARYVAGMTRVREWSLLRGGASYLMGVVVVAALLTAGIISAYFGDLNTLTLMAAVIPGLMILLATEILLGFLFGIYRPRRPGEIDRPAFDSRFLGLLTRPESIGKILNESINYQFGFEVSRSWFYRLVAKAITPLILVGVGVLFALTTMVIVPPHQEAVITRFGDLRDTKVSGLHWKLPWPLEVATKYDVHRVHEMVLGSEKDDLRPGVPILWTNQHTEGSENFLLTAPTRYVGEAEDIDDPVAGELAGARIVLKYRVSNLGDFVRSAADPAGVLRRIADRQINLYFVTHDIDRLLTETRGRAGTDLRLAIQRDVDALATPLGVEVVFVGFEAVHPPQEQEVAATFHEQINARQERLSAIEDAERQATTVLAEVAGSRDRALGIDRAIFELDRRRQEVSRAAARQTDADESQRLADEMTQQEVEIERLLDEAGGRAAELIYEARAYRWEVALNERARAMRTASLLQAYRNAPDYFRKRMELQTLGDGLAQPRKVIIVGDEAGSKDIRINLETQTDTLNQFLTGD
jgi:membrane protease subunit HflK